METLLRLQFNSNTMLDLHLMNYIGKKYTSYHIVLFWIQNRANFNINVSTDVLTRMPYLAKLKKNPSPA